MNCSRDAARNTLLELRRGTPEPKTEEEFEMFEDRLAATITYKIYKNLNINNVTTRIELQNEIEPPTSILFDWRHVDSIGQKKDSHMLRNKLSDLPVQQDCSSSTSTD